LEVHQIERGKPLLKAGSIPIIFPNLPSCFTKNIKKRKLPTEKNSSVEKQQISQKRTR